jgi:hypothetical protein
VTRLRAAISGKRRYVLNSDTQIATSRWLRKDVLSEGSGEARGERVSVPCLAEGVCENSSQRTMSAAFDADHSDRVDDDGSAHTASLPVFFPRLRRP